MPDRSGHALYGANSLCGVGTSELKMVRDDEATKGEWSVWNAYNGFISRSEPYGVFVKLEPGNVWSVSMRYEDLNNKMINTYYTACESGNYLFMNNDIIYVAKETEGPVPFTLTVYAEDDTVVASARLHFEAGTEKMYLIYKNNSL